jgi:2-dehydropantoate 2-reductase
VDAEGGGERAGVPADVRGVGDPAMITEPIVVWGAGAMGGSVGAWLHRAGRSVMLVDADRAHVEAIRSEGLRITGPVDEFVAHVPAFLPEEVEAPLHAVLLAVKAHHTRAAVERIGPLLADDGFVVSVQNGLNERVIAEAVGAGRTVGCFVNFGADVIEPGIVMRGNRGAVVVGELDGARTGRIRGVHALFSDFDPEAILTDNIWGFLWGKLAYGAMLFATALSDASIANVLADEEVRPALIALAREVMQVAAARGVRPEPFDGFDPNAFVPGVPEAEAVTSLDRLVAFNRGSAKSHSGVWRDLAVRRRKTEVDEQIAPIAALGREAGVETPLVRRLVGLIHEVEEGRRGQGRETLLDFCG